MAGASGPYYYEKMTKIRYLKGEDFCFSAHFRRISLKWFGPVVSQDIMLGVVSGPRSASLTGARK